MRPARASVTRRKAGLMSRLRSLRTAAALAAAALALPLLTVTSSAAGAAGQARSSAWGGGLPAHIFAPYFEAYHGDSPAALVRQSGAKYLTMAFIQTPKQGLVHHRLERRHVHPDRLVDLRRRHRHDPGGRRRRHPVLRRLRGRPRRHRDRRQLHPASPTIAAAYEKVITTYNVTRLDLDTEDNSLTNTAGIDRRNKAIKLVEDWAARRHRRGAVRLHAADQRRPGSTRPAAWPCCATRSRTTPGSTSSTS